VLARLNPEATGVTSDDGFTIGQFTVSDTVNLLLLGTLLDLVGAGVYALLRGLRIGPRWSAGRGVSETECAPLGALRCFLGLFVAANVAVAWLGPLHRSRTGIGPVISPVRHSTWP
jgi:hypothetical protein